MSLNSINRIRHYSDDRPMWARQESGRDAGHRTGRRVPGSQSPVSIPPQWRTISPFARSCRSSTQAAVSIPIWMDGKSAEIRTAALASTVAVKGGSTQSDGQAES